MKTRYYIFSAAGSATAAITKDDIIFIISVIIAVLTLISGYLDRRDNKTPK